MPLNADGCLVDQTPLSTHSSDRGAHAPPLYGDHVLDQLYADMDQAGLMTPLPRSGGNTPFFAQSRAGSSENLASLNTAVETNGAVPPADLNQRLQDLNLSSRNSSFLRMSRAGNSGGNTPHERYHPDQEGGYFDSMNSSQPLSRRVSEEEEHPVSNLTSGQHTPEHMENNPALPDLSKVPSYATAVKAPVRGMSYSAALPDYNTAVSTPSSPNRTFSFPTTPSAGAAPRRVERSVHTPIGDSDAQRRLLLMRNRERAH